MQNIFFISGQRTPFTSFGGSLKDQTATDLAVHATKAVLTESKADPRDIQHVIMGNVVQSSKDAAYLARHVGLRSGIPVPVGALTLNRLCGSGFQSWISAAQMIATADAESVIAGGTEQMSQIPYVLRGARFEGYRMGSVEVEDFMTSSLTDSHAGIPMAMTAETLGLQYEISREACDEYSYATQQRYKKALEAGILQREISPLTLETKKGLLTISKDEHPKPDVTLEKIKLMKPLLKERGLVTAATASGIVDGAAASLLCSESYAKSKKWIPLARLVSWAVVGCDPKIMGIGPAEAIRAALAKARLQLDQMDLIEVNEAFAAQYLSVEKELGLNRSLTNVNGGAIAVGHPLAASGTRIMNHLVYELQRTQKKYAIGSACIGGGQGIAIIIERM